jgi:hypothetical protein
MSCSALVFSRKTLAEVASDSACDRAAAQEFRRIIGETPRAYRVRYARPDLRYQP